MKILLMFKVNTLAMQSPHVEDPGQASMLWKAGGVYSAICTLLFNYLGVTVPIYHVYGHCSYTTTHLQVLLTS